jgi:hypothetical protein
MSFFYHYVVLFGISTNEHLRGNDVIAQRFNEACGALFIDTNNKRIFKIYDSIYG